MTGFGEAHHHSDDVAISVELRTINSRYFKLSMRTSEGYSALEADIENVVRQQIRRGTVQVSLRVDRAKPSDAFKLNTSVLDSYRQQLTELQKTWKSAAAVSIEHLLALPGVVIENPVTADDAERDWPMIRSTIEAAMVNLAKMRADEGRAMENDLRSNCGVISQQMQAVEGRAPLVAEAYRTRLADRLRVALADFNVHVNPADLIREVSLFAERSDISEEIVRLRSHVEQFQTTLTLAESSGRKLEFLTQEMFRETNTIGSKANDVEISRYVIDVKAAIERIKEQIQNVE